jgi:transcriptional regulator with XRE-family HTH domain
MRNTPGKRWNGSSVAVHGPALRHIRQLTGLTTAQLADEADITRDYLRKIELGFNRSVAPSVYARLIFALRIDDRRVLLADPWPFLADQETDEPVIADPEPEGDDDPETGDNPGPEALADRVAAHARQIAERDRAEEMVS